MAKEEIVFPKTRKEAFIALFKYHKMDMVKLNLLTFLFGLVSVGLIYFTMLLIGNVPSLIGNGTLELVKPEDVDYSILFTSLVYLNGLFIALIIANIPLFLALGGLIFSLSQIMYGVSDYSPGHDFFIGIKRNWKNNLLMSIIFSLASEFSVFVSSYYILNEAPVVVKVISFIVAFMVILFIALYTFIGLNYNNIYKSNMINLIKNSFLICFTHPIKTLGILILAVVPFLLLFVQFIIPIFPLIMMFFGFSYFGVIEILYSNSLFDLYINKKAHPKIVDRETSLDKSNKE